MNINFNTGIRYCFMLWLLFAGSATVAADFPLKLSEKERAWIIEHPELTVANELDWPPFDYVDDGKAAGYSIDVVRLIEQKTGLQMNFTNGYTWRELMQKFKAGRIDIMPAIYINDERRKYTLFTKSYYSQPSVMVVHRDNQDIHGVNNLAGKRVAGIRGFSITATLENIIPDITMVPVNNILEGLKAVSLDKADAFIDSIGTVSYILENNYIPNVKVISKVENDALANPPLHIGVAKDNLLLRSILDKALASFSRDEKRMLVNRWFHAPGLDEKRVTSKREIFTAEQQAWLISHPKIRIGIMDDWAPMDYLDSSGTPQGIGVAYIKSLNRRLGNRLEIVPGLWNDIFEAAQTKRIDGLMDITPKPWREEFLHFTKPYIEVPHIIFTRKGEPPKMALTDLYGRTVGVEKGFFLVKVLQEEYPQINLLQYPTTSDALDALSRSEVDAYIGNRAVASYIVEHELIRNIMAHGKITETSSIVAIGVRKDWPILRDILQRALDDISPVERSKIVNLSPQQDRIDGIVSKLAQKLTKAERAWLSKRPSIRLGVDPEWPPIEWIDEDGVYQGMTSDYVTIVTDMLGLQVVKPERLLWMDVLEKARLGQIDLLTAVVSTPKRREYLNFTEPYLRFPFVVFTRDDAPLVTELRDIYGSRVGVEEGYFTQEFLERDHPSLELTRFKTTKEILHALSLGTLDAYVGNLTVVVYLLNREGLSNIKVAAPTDYHYNLSVGVRKDLPELLSIIEKSIPMINEAQRNEIRHRWLKLNYEVGVDYTLVIRATIIVSIIIVMFSAWLIFIQRQKRILKQSKAETEQANAAYLLANNQLIEANTKLKEMDRMKSMFVASISHELRTPLNSIIGFSTMMVQSSFGQLNDKYQDYSIRINNSGQHLLHLITDIIDISKIEAGRVDIVLDTFDVQDIVSEAVEGLTQQIERKGLTLELNVQQSVTMRTDKRRLYQSLLNMLSNAMKYTERGGIILTVMEQGPNVILEINDTGIGISDADLPRLFDAFERMESHLQVKAGGTGLGLYLTKKIVTELLQGDVSVESELGQGSTFWIKVPKMINPEITTILAGGL